MATSAIDAFVDACPPTVQATVHALRARLRDLLPEAHEHLFVGWRAVNYSHDRRPMKTGICGFEVRDTHVRLYFFDGVDLPDPDVMLEGDAKRLRHVKLGTPDTAADERLTNLILLAAAFSDPALTHPPGPPRSPTAPRS